MIRSMQLTIATARLEDRRMLQHALDRLRLNVSTEQQLDQFEQQAVETILGKSKDAFDLSKEDPRLVRRYDTGRFNTALRVPQRFSTLGKQMLLARRLCEAGCGFVTIHNPGWDMHGGPTQFNVPYGMERLGRPLDQAVSTFLPVLHLVISPLPQFILNDLGRPFGRMQQGTQPSWFLLGPCPGSAGNRPIRLRATRRCGSR